MAAARRSCWSRSLRDTNDGATLRHGVLIPTYRRHQRHYCGLLASIFQRSARSGRFVLASAFSSAREHEEILAGCHACAGREDIRMEALVFDHSYHNRQKFTYQCAKKLWALVQLRAERVMIFDSDFLLMGASTPIPQMIDRYARVEFETISPVALDDSVRLASNQLLGTNFTDFPLDPPWIFERTLVVQLVGFLAREEVWRGVRNESAPSREGVRDAVDDGIAGATRAAVAAILSSPTPLFEVVLYRFFRRHHRPGDVRLIKAKTEGLLFETALSDRERESYDPPPPATTQRTLGWGYCCRACWILTHLDRAHAPTTTSCIPAGLQLPHLPGPCRINRSVLSGGRGRLKGKPHNECFQADPGYRGYRKKLQANVTRLGKERSHLGTVPRNLYT
ncbi:hypothetical protein AB1Y20_018860 [Prymnesium parvum]|uniref:Nucleotide-diphospho-sugar transferase domain-containing protein n=1 Tax=Prymnesium parvum TaxID=97485 RepID=A0AB34JTP8_PRYPA